MKKLKVAKFAMLVILLSILFYPGNGLAKLIHSKMQKILSQGIEQDSLIKSKQEIMEYLKKSAPPRGPGDTIKDGPPLRLEIPFDFNSAELTESAKIQLDNLAGAMQSEQYSGISIKLAGYTDERGTQEYNSGLSQRRVESAKNYLIRNFNILPGQIYAIGYGESNLIIKNAKTEAEHSVNRRVEISPGKNTVTNDNSDVIINDHKNSDGLSAGSNRFEWGVFHIDDDNSQKLIKADGSSALESGDKYKIYFKPPQPSYVYIYQEDSNGNGSWLFPRASEVVKNPLNNTDNWIPSRNTSFSLDDNTGAETIYLVASDQRDRKLEDLIFLKVKNPHERDTITVIIKMRGVAGSISDKVNRNLYMTEIKSDHWDFYVEIKFKHE
ncbi:MAG: hypothetical protein A2057_03545 [Ignavibacteria bacterium GWA2_35_9]|nr:MAG: hypothetical protein A2057_03545 [Ignavibacteria bacterium GWA2_35_9]OGU48483.1 MAG: hypothetical protein A2000_09640 [Ignavibacteria bacterium GWB2_36_8]